MNDKVQQAVVAAAETLRAQHIDLLRGLVGIPSPAGSETVVQQHIATHMEQLGLVVDVFEADLDRLRQHPEYPNGAVEDTSAGRPNVVGRLRGYGDGRSLLLYAHPDTEPLANEGAWSTAPLQAVIDNGRLVGLGAADDKAGVAALLAVPQVLQAAGVRLAGEVLLVSCLGKLGGGAGTLAVIEKGYRADAAVYVHPAETGNGFRDLKVLTRGVLPFSICVTGCRPAPLEIGTPHSALPHQGVSAIDKAVKVLSALQAWDVERGNRVHHPLLDEQLGRSTTFNVGEIASSAGSRLVPEWCEMRGEVTFPPGETLESLTSELSNLISAVSHRDEWLTENPPKLEINGVRSSSAATGVAHPLVTLLADVIQSQTGELPAPYAGHRQSDIRFPILYGDMPTVGIGPDAGNFYGPDEWVEVEGFLEFVIILCLVCVRWCGVIRET